MTTTTTTISPSFKVALYTRKQTKKLIEILFTIQTLYPTFTLQIRERFKTQGILLSLSCVLYTLLVKSPTPNEGYLRAFWAIYILRHVDLDDEQKVILLTFLALQPYKFALLHWVGRK
jgi:hypothetical protein